MEEERSPVKVPAKKRKAAASTDYDKYVVCPISGEKLMALTDASIATLNYAAECHQDHVYFRLISNFLSLENKSGTQHADHHGHKRCVRKSTEDSHCRPNN